MWVSSIWVQKKIAKKGIQTPAKSEVGTPMPCSEAGKIPARTERNVRENDTTTQARVHLRACQ